MLTLERYRKDRSDLLIHARTERLCPSMHKRLNQTRLMLAGLRRRAKLAGIL